MTPNRLAVAAALSLAGAALGAAGAQAAVLLTYTGNPFTQVQGAYTKSDRVTGTVVLAALLGSNLNEVNETPLSFAFSDGVMTQTNLNSNSTQFLFSTDGTGAISAWYVVADDEIGHGSTEILTGDLPSFDIFDRGSIGFNPATAFGRNDNSPGTWTISAIAEPVPEPASWAPTLLSLAGLAVASRARRREPPATA